MESKKKVNSCGNCGSSFKNRQHLYRHRLICITKVEYKCDSCTKVFGRSDNLKRHSVICKGSSCLAASGYSFSGSEDIVSTLVDQLSDNSNPSYIIKSISVFDLENARKSDSSIVIKSIKGSASFRAMVFEPNKTVFKAATRLCICDSCQMHYGSCDSFEEYELNTMMYKTPVLRTQSHDTEITKYENDQEDWDFLAKNTIVAIAANSKIDDIWFIKIVENDCFAKNHECDDYGHTVASGVRFLKGKFLEKKYDERNCSIYSLSNKTTYFYRESIVYPYVNFQETKKGLKLMNDELSEILSFVEENDYSSM